MLLLLDKSTNKIQAFASYTGLCNYIERQERYHYLDMPQRHPPKRKWGFTQYPYHRAAALVAHISGAPIPDIKKQKDIRMRNFDVLEILQGNPKMPIFIALDPDIDLEPLRKEWCHKYCKANGYLLAEVLDAEDFQKLENPPGDADKKRLRKTPEKVLSPCPSLQIDENNPLELKKEKTENA